jgi:peptidyl-prolyl cis-trans isomerase B (cyclophilin B)
MIQGGGFAAGKMDKEKPTAGPIKNESDNGLRNERGTIAMARTGDPDSATAQFYINVADNRFLDRDQAADRFGYCVFGRVTEGMDVVDQIKSVPTATKGHNSDVPVQDVVIKSIRRAD